jgi:hypothetical protein
LQNPEAVSYTEAEIRGCIRLHLQYVRRGRTSHSMPHLHRDGKFAAKVLADFVIDRLDKIDRHTITNAKQGKHEKSYWERQGELAERLRRLTPQ